MTDACECGAPMVRRMVAALCGPGLPGPVYGDPECSSEEHRAERAAQDAIDRQQHEDDVIRDAIAKGLILP